MSYTSENKEVSQLVKDFLSQIEKKLPEWLKDDKHEKQEVLDELEAHLWDKAEELAAGQPITPEIMQQAIQSMGTPESITREYKKRGTPYVYITKEWWEYYKKVITIVFSIIFVIGVIGFIISLFNFNTPFLDDLGAFWRGIWGGLAVSGIIITAIFVGISMEGFLPKDLPTSKPKPGVLVCEPTQPKIKVSIKKKDKVHPPINKKELFGNAFWDLLWGLLFIIQPIESINQYFTPEFLAIIQMGGAITVAISIVRFIQVFFSMEWVFLQRILLLVIAGINFLNIFVSIEMLNSSLAMQIFANPVSWLPLIAVKIILYLSIFGTCVETLKQLGNIGRYRAKLEKYNAVTA